jgi:hypothetical protein
MCHLPIRYLFFVGAGFIPARKPARLLLRVGINPAPTSDVRLSMKIRIAELYTILLVDTSGTQH